VKEFKTPKGTTLQLRQIQGKDYLGVQERIIWFTEENPSYSIHTEFKILTEKAAVATALVKILQDGKVVRESTATKTETPQGFQDFVEKAETGAIGRALANLGYGTQFAHLDYAEGDRIVDGPRGSGEPSRMQPETTSRKIEGVPKGVEDLFEPVGELIGEGPEQIKQKPITLFKKYSGKKYGQVPLDELSASARWLKEQANKKKEPMSKWGLEFIRDVEMLQFAQSDFAPSDEEIPF
jgi:hypothetical protein